MDALDARWSREFKTKVTPDDQETGYSISNVDAGGGHVLEFGNRPVR